jgi:hypothetical protein
MRLAMQRTRPLRSPFVVTLGAAALLGGCGGQVEGEGDPLIGNPPPQVVDGGPRDAVADAPQFCDSCNPPPPICPAAPPIASSGCYLPNGTSCNWGGECDEISAECEDGRWLIASSNPPAPVCPLAVPSVGDDCSALCLPPDFGCEFPGGECPFPASGSWTGACSGGVWTNVYTTCIEPTNGDGGPFDAGPWPDSGL